LGQSILAAHKQQILAWWNADIRRPNILMALLKPLGYNGSKRTLQRYISRLRSAQGLPPIRIRVVQPLPKVVDPQTPPLTPRRVAYLVVLRPENRASDDTALLERLAKQHPDITLLINLVDDFLQLLRQRQAKAFDDWLLKALTCKIQPLKKFAEGLIDDYAAVKASMMTDVSNGPVEGLNNKLKMLKRQMYGRAGLDLLAKRFIMAA
jgi:transposase